MTKNRESAVIPADGEEFELTIACIDPMQMVRDDGHDPRGWKFIGSPVAPQTRRFQLVRVDYSRDLTYSRNLDEVREILQIHGHIPEGQWREAFKQSFHRYDGRGPVGFADPSWVFPGGGACFLALFGRDEGWCPDLIWADGHRSNRWRWFVASQKQTEDT
ncbi:MAG: hypothetical protein AAB849_00870 [Patescibacteria group bacterium]